MAITAYFVARYTAAVGLTACPPKVVQRVPVRITWVHPPEGLTLRAGLSAGVTVHTK
ncbi:hypothetical protein [Corallococcus terminator]|uniref:hypothetical protein n=1 Tax=Corallococcus terminator TaxID=2316733 RepID=UPI00142EDE61|nr:hypothetical protein [Corallococcus terminator]